MKRTLGFTMALLLSSAMFFVVVCAGADSVTKPTKGTWSGVTNFLGQQECQNGSMKIEAIGNGNMTLTGKSQWYSEGCLNMATGVAPGTAIITAANGDKIFLDATITFTFTSPTSGTWEQLSWGTGGTGRFENTEGVSHSEGVFQFVSESKSLWAGTNEGVLTFMKK